jgi:hypothetical protein
MSFDSNKHSQLAQGSDSSSNTKCATLLPYYSRCAQPQIVLALSFSLTFFLTEIILPAQTLRIYCTQKNSSNSVIRINDISSCGLNAELYLHAFMAPSDETQASRTVNLTPDTNQTQHLTTDCVL